MNIKRHLLFGIILIAAVIYYFTILLSNKSCPLATNFPKEKLEFTQPDTEGKTIEEAFRLLKSRYDQEALLIFDKILKAQPDNLDALWGKAEVLRRNRSFIESEKLLNTILKKNPGHLASLVSLSYIRYRDDELDKALKLINKVLNNEYANKEDRALAYMMLGSINSRRSAKGWIFSKIKYGTSIRCYFLKAKELAPDLPEVHLGLGTFYLLAPTIVGGDLQKAMEELELTVKMAPTFATANARLGQAYKKAKDEERYSFYIEKTRQLDPDNEVLEELSE